MITAKKSASLILVLSFFLFGTSCGTVADGGIFKSEDEGESWAQKVFVGQQKKKVLTIGNVNVEGIFFDTNNPDVMYLTSKDSGIYKSDTAGDVWRQLSITTGRIRDLAINPVDNSTLYSVQGVDIIKSTDAGEHWEVMYSDPQGGVIMQVGVNWYNPTDLTATTSIGTVLKSADAGVTWKVVYQVDEPLTELIIDPSDSRVMTVLEYEKNIHTSVDGGLTWTPLFTDEFRDVGGDADVARSLVLDPNNTKSYYSTSPEGIFHSVDGGLTWNFVNTLIERGAIENASIRNVTLIPGNSNTILFTIGHTVHKTTDAGVTWKTIENFPSSRRITATAIDSGRPQTIYAGTELVEQKKGIFGR